MSLAAGLYYLNGKDLWTIFGVAVESGSDDFLKYPPRKPTTTHDWGDANGIDVDLSRVFFEENKITLRCSLLADTKAEFWLKRGGFLAEWAQPGTHTLRVSRLEQSFNVFYKDCTDFDTFKTIKVGGVNKVGCKFTLNLVEMEPSFGENGLEVFIVDEQNRFLVT